MSRRRSRSADKRQAKAAGRRTEAAAPSLRWLRWIAVIGVVAVVVIGGVLLSASRNQDLSATPTAVAYRAGSVTWCNSVEPPFAQTLGFSRNAVLDTRSQDVKGVVLLDLDANGNPIKSFQDPTWTSAGFLGPPVLDRAGNIYVAPIPAINVLDNPLSRANFIYRIDGATGKMSALLDLPTTASPTLENPYGIMALAYDCDTNSLYASSVFGSTRLTQAGRLYRIDLDTFAIGSILDGVDAFGLAVFNSAQGKRLYWGSARTDTIDSINLDTQGNFVGAIHNEISLSDLGFHGDERARDLRFTQDTLQVKTIQFDFNLIASTETRQTALEYHYDPAQDTWQLVSSKPIN